MMSGHHCLNKKRFKSRQKEQTGRQTDRETEGRAAVLLNAPTGVDIRSGSVNVLRVTYVSVVVMVTDRCAFVAVADWFAGVIVIHSYASYS